MSHFDPELAALDAALALCEQADATLKALVAAKMPLSRIRVAWRAASAAGDLYQTVGLTVFERDDQRGADAAQVELGGNVVAFPFPAL